ncbi:velvet factor-domain-containing protein [Umbelopsis sp. AD052]|nr:velvet factor-domain-containing protein [Umbelopsis sp. AD052]
MYASLMAADIDEELHLLRDGKTRSTTGSVVSSLYHLKDIDNADAGFFVFPDLSVRMEGNYRLKLSLFEIIGKEVFHCKSIITHIFVVYSAKRFPGMEESTFLSRSFADQGLKIRIRKEIRVRRKQSKRKESLPDPSGQKQIMYNKRPRNSSINQDDQSDGESSDGEFHVADRQREHNVLDSKATVQSTEPWNPHGNYSQPAKLVRSEPPAASSPGMEPSDTIERLSNSNRSNSLIMGNEMMPPPANRPYQAPHSPMPPTNIAAPKRFHQSLPGHGFTVSVPQAAASSTRNQAAHAQDRSASEPTLRMPSSRQPGPHQSPWLISHNDHQQPNDNWYHRPPEDQTHPLHQQRGSSTVEDDPHSSSPHMANVFYSTSPGSMGLNHGMDAAAYGARRAGPTGSARFSNQPIGQQQQQQHTRVNHSDTYSPIPEISMRQVDSHNPYSRFSAPIAPNQRQAFARPRQSTDVYPNVHTFSNSAKNTGNSSEQDHILYRDPYSNNRRTANHLSGFPQAALHPHEDHLPQASHNTVSVPGGLEWYDESDKFSQEAPQGHPQIKHGQPLQRPPSQPQPPQQQQSTSSMYPVSKARMYYNDVPRR